MAENASFEPRFAGKFIDAESLSAVMVTAGNLTAGATGMKYRDSFVRWNSCQVEMFECGDWQGGDVNQGSHLLPWKAARFQQWGAGRVERQLALEKGGDQILRGRRWWGRLAERGVGAWYLGFQIAGQFGQWLSSVHAVLFVLHRLVFRDSRRGKWIVEICMAGKES
jgi:hypothetical protein